MNDEERVYHPTHYTWLLDAAGVEPYEICRLFDFSLGSALKYILRAGHKKEDGLTQRQKKIEDLQKAVFYLNDEIERLQEEEKNARVV